MILIEDRLAITNPMVQLTIEAFKPFEQNATNLGQSIMSQSNVKADENTYISCTSILFGRFSEEFRYLNGIAH